MIFIATLCLVLNIIDINSAQVAPALSLTDRWNLFKKNYSKSYISPILENKSREIWAYNTQYIITHNRLADLNLTKFRLGENQFMDYDESEFKRVRLGYNLSLTNNQKRKKRQGKSAFSVSFYARPKTLVLPTTFDARSVTRNGRRVSMVTPVKDQGPCGSCWAFSASDAISGQYHLKTNQLVDFSNQELVDCSVQWANGGCDGGGTMENVYRYAWDNNGLLPESAYKYSAKDGECRFVNTSSRLATTTGFVRVQANEINIRAALVNQGPLAVGINADPLSFRLYSSGVYSDPDCANGVTDLNHAVLLIGYGTDVINGVSVPFWLLKNSWSKGWGISGFMKILRSNDNICGIMNAVTYPILA